ncbi:GD23984, partial [Drosophila simulans]
PSSADALGVTWQSPQVQGRSILPFRAEDDSALNVLRWEIVVCRWNGNCSIIIMDLMEDPVLANKQIAFKNYNYLLDLQGI